MNGVIIDPQDKRFYIKNPGETHFSPAKNRAVIAETIRETEDYFRKLNEVYNDELGERIDILSMYGTYRLGRGGTKAFEQWGGKDLVNRVIGEKILSKVRVADSVNTLQGNRKKSILL